MSYESYSCIDTKIDDRIALVTLNRPDTLNANNAELHREMATIFYELQWDDDVDVIVLTGAGRAFSAGGDMAWMQFAIDNPESFDHATVQNAKHIVFSLLDLEKPLIAKVNGHAVGLGATLALFSDVIFAAESAKIGDPHVAIGLVAGDGGPIIWPQLIGYARAKEYLLTGDLVTAKQAEQMGLINHCVPDEELDEVVQKFALRIRNGATKAIRWTKVATNVGLKQLAHATMDSALAYEAITNRSDDHREAVSAFVQKRTPKFSGR